ncbi:MAG: zinc ribbon domain-containing protein [Acidobacteria bacterium]|nr:zinc ribbon domain-containing protein [Acidobacteriota bacterium]
MDARCRNCGANVHEEEAFCPKCGAVMGSDMATQSGGEDDSWKIPETLMGQKFPVAPSKSEQTTGSLPVAGQSSIESTPSAQTDAQAQTEPAPLSSETGARGGTMKFFIIGLVAILLIGGLLALLFSRA